MNPFHRPTLDLLASTYCGTSHTWDRKGTGDNSAIPRARYLEHSATRYLFPRDAVQRDAVMRDEITPKRKSRAKSNGLVSAGFLPSRRRRFVSATQPQWAVSSPCDNSATRALIRRHDTQFHGLRHKLPAPGPSPSNHSIMLDSQRWRMRTFHLVSSTARAFTLDP
jgi:hypothetical protein